MKKGLLSVFTAAALMLPFAPSAFAQGDDGQFVITSQTVQAGEEFTLDVGVENSQKLAAFVLYVDYDDTVFTLKSAEKVDYNNVGLGPVNNLPFTLFWYDALGSYSVQDGVYARLTFTSKADASSGDYDFTLSYGEDDCIDIETNSLDFGIVNGKVTLSGGSSQGNTTTKVTEKPGDTTSAASDKTTTTKKTDKSETKTETSSVTSGKDDSSDETVTTADESSEESSDSSDAEQTTVTTTSASDVGSEEADESSSAAANDSQSSTSNSKDSSSSDEEESGSNVVIAVIAFAALCAVIAAVFIVVKKKGK